MTRSCLSLSIYSPCLLFPSKVMSFPLLPPSFFELCGSSYLPKIFFFSDDFLLFSLIQFSFFLSACVCANMCLYVCINMQTRGQCQVFSSFETRALAEWMTCPLNPSITLPLFPRAGNIDTCHSSRFFVVVLNYVQAMMEFRSSCLYGKHLLCSTMSPDPDDLLL